MTTETYPGPPQFTVSGTGPYAVNHDYLEGSLYAVVVSGGTSALIPYGDLTIDPASGSSGNVWLSAADATLYDGYDLYIIRDTAMEQGWAGNGGSREAGLEAQLDRNMQKVQEFQREDDRTLRLAFWSSVVLQPVPDPVDGAALIGNPAGDGYVNGTPSAATVLTSDTTFRVPTDYATLAAALDDVQKYGVTNGAQITILLEAGYEWPSGLTLIARDLSHVTISAEDSVVNTASTFPTGDALITFIFSRSPIWNILVDMGGRGDNGVELTNSDMHVMDRCGVMNAGANAQTREGYGSNFLLLGTSGLFCDPVRQTVLTTSGHTAAGGTTTAFPLAAADQQPDGYYIGHVISVTGGADTSEADIIDYDNATNTVTLRYADRWNAANNGSGLSYTIELLRGLVASGGARRGVTNTWSSEMSLVASDLTNNGSDARDAGHCAVFHRRSSRGQLDRANFSGSVAGIRASRSNQLSARESYAARIPGSVITCAEGAQVSAALIAAPGCGLATGGDPLPLLLLSSNEGRGGAGAIDVAGAEFDGAVSPVARIDSEGGKIDMGDARAFEIEDVLATADSGEIDVTRMAGSTAAGAGAAHVVLTASLSASVPAIGFTWDGQGGANYIYRAINMGRGTLENAVITGAATELLDIDEGAAVYFENTTLDGTVVAASSGFTWEANGVVPTRADAVTVIDKGAFTGNDVPIWIDGLGYKGLSGATAIPDMNDMVPLGDATPEHFGAAGDGVTDDTTAVVAWMAYGGDMEARGTYLLTTLGGVAGRCPVPNRVTLDATGALFKLPYTDTSDNHQFSFDADHSVIAGFRVLWTDNATIGHYAERGVRLAGDHITFDDYSFEAETEQPDTTDQDEDRCLIVTGTDCKIRDGRAKNIYAVARLSSTAARTRLAALNMENFGKGVTVEQGADNSVIEGVQGLSISSAAGGNPGENIVSGATDGLTVQNCRGTASEHGFYFAAANGTPAVDFTAHNLVTYATGQCGVKVRNLDDANLSDISVTDCATGNTVGPNEEVMRVETCRRMHVKGVTGRASSKANPGNALLHIDSCQEVYFTDTTSDRPGAALVEITDGRYQDAGETGYVPADIVVNGMICLDIGAVPAVDIDVVGDLDRVTILNAEIYGGTSNLITLDVTGTINTNPLCRGEFSTTGTIKGGADSASIDLNPSYST